MHGKIFSIQFLIKFIFRNVTNNIPLMKNRQKDFIDGMDNDEAVILFGYVTVRCGNAPTVAFNNASGERMRPASSIQRHPR